MVTCILICVCVIYIIVQIEVCTCYYKSSNEGIHKIYHPRTLQITFDIYIPRIFVKDITLNRVLLHAGLVIITGSNLSLLLSLLLMYISFFISHLCLQHTIKDEFSRCHIVKSTSIQMKD